VELWEAREDNTEITTLPNEPCPVARLKYKYGDTYGVINSMDVVLAKFIITWGQPEAATGSALEDVAYHWV
jgi:hypothetical protein